MRKTSGALPSKGCADNTDIVRGRAGRDTADTVQEVNNSLRSLIRHDARKAGNLPEQVKLLASVLCDAHVDGIRRHPSNLAEKIRDLGNRASFHAQPVSAADLDSTIGTDLPLSAELGVGINENLEHVGATDRVSLGAAVAPGFRTLIGRNSAIKRRLAESHTQRASRAAAPARPAWTATTLTGLCQPP